MGLWRRLFSLKKDIPQYTVEEIQGIVSNNDIEAMRKYLEAGGDPDIRIWGGDNTTPLAEAKTVEMAELLLKYKADVHAKIYHDRRTPLLWQVLIHYNPDVVKLLLEADPSIINDKDEKKETVLHYAARRSDKPSFEIVKTLLAHRPKIDIDAKSIWSRAPDSTALDYAVASFEEYATDIIDLLVEAGANTTLHNNPENFRNSGFRRKEYVKKFIERNIAGKKIGNFILKRKTRRNIIRNAYRPPNGNNNLGGNAYQALAARWDRSVRGGTRRARK
jgi:ankyrin repeat protein